MKISDHIIADFSTTDSQGINKDCNRMPVVAIRDSVMFPYSTVTFSVGREKSLNAVKKAQAEKRLVFLVTQKDPNVDEPKARDLYRMGVGAEVLKIITLPDGSNTVFGITHERFTVKKFFVNSEMIEANVDPVKEERVGEETTVFKTFYDSLNEVYQNMLRKLSTPEASELRFAVDNLPDEWQKVGFMVSHSPLSSEDKMKILKKFGSEDGMVDILHSMIDACKVLNFKDGINNMVNEELSRQQKEHYLQQQLRVIQDELGGSTEEREAAELRERAKKMVWKPEVQMIFDRELKKMERFAVQNPEYSIQYNYLETMLELPWDRMSGEDFTLAKVRKILDKDHSGLEKVKERIVEQMAVVKLRKDMKSPIICLVGPPGVGKTSLGKSVAEALGREYARISLGGLHDEAELRGHRRTYIGAMPGRIISALKKVKTGDPVIVLDEIDKIGKDYKGDPSQALLEVLDPEQNNTFHDNYLDVDYDLSNVLFLATANDLSTVSGPLLDRMEVIHIPGYLPEEKVEIASKHLVAKELEAHGLEPEEISFTPEALRMMIDGYTREAGVRQLRKVIARALRKIACKKAEEQEYPREVTADMITELLGQQKTRPEKYEGNDYIGVVTGLAWTPVGGDILFIETSLSDGKGEKLTLTGQLGDVMKESAVIALQYLKSHAAEYSIDPELFTKRNIHIHVPEGAIPKDGPSAGITMLTSLASAFTGHKVRERIAMTGEMTLRGKVLPVGGIKEKILAAKNSGITTILMSKENERDILEIEKKYLEGLTFRYVDDASEVLSFSLL